MARFTHPTCGSRRQVLDVGVEPRAVAERVGEDPVERAPSAAGCCRGCPRSCSAPATTLSRWSSAGLRSARLCGTRAVSSLDRVEVETSRLCTACASRDQRRNRTSESFISPTMSWSRSSRTPETRSRFFSSVLIWSSRAAMFAESRETPLEGAAELLGRVAGQVGERRRATSASWSVSICSEVCGQAGEGVDDVVRRAGALDRDLAARRRAGRSRPAPATRYIAPSRVLTLIAARVSSPNSAAVVDPEGRP